MLHGKDVRLSTLEDRRDQLRDLIPNLPDKIRYSETFNVPLSELMRAVKKHQLEGIVAKRSGSPYRSSERSADWLKWPANRGQGFVIGGYIPNGDVLDSLLVGYYEGQKLMYAASVRAGIPAQYRVCCWLISTRCAYHAVRSRICPIAVRDAGARASWSRKWRCDAG
jgi:bifunctional non-homologous end joining protein LigD